MQDILQPLNNSALLQDYPSYPISPCSSATHPHVACGLAKPFMNLNQRSFRRTAKCSRPSLCGSGIVMQMSPMICYREHGRGRVAVKLYQ